MIRSLPEKVARSAYVGLWVLDHLFGSRRWEPFRKRRASLHGALTRPRGLPNRFAPVREVRVPYLDARLLRELDGTGPVLFKGLASAIPAIRNWTFPSLIARYGEIEQAFQRAGNEYYRTEFLRLSKVLNGIQAGEPTHALYGGGEGDVFNLDPRMRDELNLSSWADAEYLDRSPYRLSHIFITGKGNWSPVHTEIGHILSTQVQGSRRWTILAPSCSPYLFPEISRSTILYSHLYANASRLRDESFGLTGWECVMDEGDVLFCPLYHWHFVETLRPSVSIASTWARLGSLARHPIMTSLFLTSRSPSLPSYLLGLRRKADRWYGDQRFLDPGLQRTGR